MATLFSFRLVNNDELEKFLNGMKPGERSAYLREAVAFYYAYGEVLQKILGNTEAILQAVTAGVILPGAAEAKMPEVDAKEEMLNALVANSVDAFLDWGD